MSGDCHDGSSLSYPDAEENCFDTLDNDCDGDVDCDDMDSCKAVEPDCWVCGDGVLDPSEGCDDGNTMSGDELQRHLWRVGRGRPERRSPTHLLEQ